MPSKRLRAKGVTDKAFDSCLRQVKGPGKNEFAICTSAFNKKHGISPTSIKKDIYELPEELFGEGVLNDSADTSEDYKDLSEKELEREMKKAARDLDFERAARLRDEMDRLSS